MFRFASPEYLNLLYAVPVIFGIIYFLYYRQNKLLNGIINKKLHKSLIPLKSGARFWSKNIILILAFVLIIVSLANPQIGTKMEEVKQTGIDVYIILDVSQSMLAEDIKPSRLTRAKQQISNLIRKLKGDRIGLIVFAGAAYVQFPMTSDYSAASLFLNPVNTGTVPQPGTVIGPAIDLAVKSFHQESETQKVIIIMTDGEDHEGDLDAALKNASENNIKIYAIGYGSPEGSPIPSFNQQGIKTGFRQDSQGNVIITKIDENTLKMITEKGNGKYYRASNHDDELDLIYKELSQLEKSEFGALRITDYEDRFYYFLLPALILLLLELLISEKRSLFFAKIARKIGFKNEVSV